MTEATAADLTELQTQLTALETDHASLKTANAALTAQVASLNQQIATLQAAANGDGADPASHEVLVTMINSIETELGNAPAGDGTSGTTETANATTTTGTVAADPAPETAAS